MRFSLPKIKVKDRFFQFKLILREDRAILLICMGIALVFWVLTKLSQTYRTEKNVVFSFIVPSEKTFLEAPPTNLTVILEGVGWDLMFDFFNSRNVDLNYDLRQTNRLDLNRAQLRAAIGNTFSSNDIKIIELLNHEEIHLTLDEKLQKNIPIHLQGEVLVDVEYQLRFPPELTPDSVTVVGPSTKVSELTEWPTDSIFTSTLKGDEIFELSLKEPPLEMMLSSQKTNVSIMVEQLTERSLFVPIQILNGPENINIFPNTIRVNCTVGLSQYETLSSKDFELVVDLKDAPLQGEKNTTPILLKKFPDYVANIKYSPPSVEYFVVEAKVDSLLN